MTPLKLFFNLRISYWRDEVEHEDANVLCIYEQQAQEILALLRDFRKRSIIKSFIFEEFTPLNFGSTLEWLNTYQPK